LGSLALRTIGDLNKGAYGGVHGNIGYTGLEGAYEQYLKGKEASVTGKTFREDGCYVLKLNPRMAWMYYHY
jgi:hypothetical protein